MLDLTQANIFRNMPIKHNFFNRRSGFSSGLYASLNCSTYIGDNLDTVEKNLKQIQNFFKANILCSLKQTHSNKVYIVDNSCDKNELQQVVEADALVTNVPHIALGILTADCAPVLLYDTNNATIAAMHCGWKSARYGIIENTILEMHKLAQKTTNIIAAIGPCIQQKSYLVQENFIDNFENVFFFQKSQDGYLFDLPGYVRWRILQSGGTKVDSIDIDTYTNEYFFSFRRARQATNGICGRQLSVIMLN